MQNKLLKETLPLRSENRFCSEEILHLVVIDVEQGVVHECVGELTNCQKKMIAPYPFPQMLSSTLERIEEIVDFVAQQMAQFRIKQVAQDRTDVISSTL